MVGFDVEESLSLYNGDFVDLVSGIVFFGDGEGGVRSIIFRVCFYEEIEVEEIFIV